MTRVIGVDMAADSDETVVSLWTRPTVESPWYLKDGWMARWFGWPWRWYGRFKS